jgi:DNA-binding protein HU-beta
VIFAAITESIQKGGIVRLIGFGTFAVKQRQARTARNPRTGEAIQVPAKHVIRFSPGKALKEAVANQSKEAEASKKEKALKKG